jgi:hypothetical protein
MPLTQKVAYFFMIALGATILIYSLRGFKIGTFIPGGILLALIFLSIVSGLTYGILITRR